MEIKLKELEEAKKDLEFKLKQSKLEKSNLELKLVEKDNKLVEKDKKLNKKDEDISDLIQTNKILAKQSDDLKESIKINMTMHNYFIVNQFGDEKLDYIDMTKLLTDNNTLSQMVAKHIQLKHFSNHKENHNLILDRTSYKIYKENGVWETKDKVNLFIVNDLIKKGVINIDDFKKDENIIFELKKEKNYNKDKKSLLRNIPLPCMFNPVEAEKRLNHVQEQKENEKDDDFKEKWNSIEKKYKKELKTANKQAEVKQALVDNLSKAIDNKHIKASMVKFKNY